MPTEIKFTLNGQPVSVPQTISVAAALLHLGVTQFRKSVGGEPRTPLCGMGICFECRVNIDGKPHQKSCQVMLSSGMAVTTDE